jgi:hypothetical protein
MSDAFKISYEGLLADDHQLDMRRFGYAIVGLDHIVSAGLIAISERRVPRPRERVDFTIVAEPPREGSVEVLGGILSAAQALQTSFPFLIELLRAKAPDLVWHWLSLTFNWLGGRKKEAEPHLEYVVDAMRGIHGDTLRDRQDERAFILKLVESLRQNAARVAMPLGESSEILRIGSDQAAQITNIDVPMASAIRSKDELAVSDICQVELKIDGITKHSNRASVAFLDDPAKFYHAEIRDPVIAQTGNPYVRALDSNHAIKVFVRLSHKNDEIHRVYVLGTQDPLGDLYKAA